MHWEWHVNVLYQPHPTQIHHNELFNTYTLCCSSLGYFLQASSSSHQWSLEILQQTALQNRTRRISRFSSAAYEPFQAPTTLDPQDGPSMLHDGPSFPLFHWYWYIYNYIDICVSLYIYIYIDLLLKPRNSRVSSCVLAEKGSLPRSMKYRMTPAANTSTSGDWANKDRVWQVMLKDSYQNYDMLSLLGDVMEYHRR